MKLHRKWVICSTCAGHGASSAHLGVISDELMQDPDFATEYWSGVYDRACPDCHGSGKCLVVDQGRMTAAQREAYREQQQDEWEYQQLCEMERRMGA